MALTKEQAEAFEKVEEAVSAIMDAFGDTHDSGMTVGWVLVVNGVRQPNDDDEPLDFGSVEDELDSVSTYDQFVRRGQQPALTRGILENALDEYRNA